MLANGPSLGKARYSRVGGRRPSLRDASICNTIYGNSLSRHEAQALTYYVFVGSACHDDAGWVYLLADPPCYLRSPSFSGATDYPEFTVVFCLVDLVFEVQYMNGMPDPWLHPEVNVFTDRYSNTPPDFCG
jgi:hypothetical protein